MGTKYPGVSISGYNSSPPADDGSATEANRTKWYTIKTKITDPIKTLAESINTALATAFDYSAISKTANYTVTAAEHMKTIECDGTFTVTLGAAASLGAGFIVRIKNVGSGTITVDGNASETIDGDLTKSLAQYDSITVAVDAGAGDWNAISLIRDGLDQVSNTELSYLVGVTSAIQTQLDAKLESVAASDLTAIDATTSVMGTAQATTSGTAFDFTSIPSWATQITVILEGVSLSGTDSLLVQIGDSGGLETTGYLSTGALMNAGGNGVTSSTAGFVIYGNAAANVSSVIMTLINIDGNTWVSSHSGKQSATQIVSGGGDKTLSGTLDRLRLTRTGTDTFDAGNVNIRYS